MTWKRTLVTESLVSVTVEGEGVVAMSVSRNPELEKGLRDDDLQELVAWEARLPVGANLDLKRSWD